MAGLRLKCFTSFFLDKERTMRGGSYSSPVDYCAPGHREPLEPVIIFDALGFRFVIRDRLGED